MSGLFVVLCCGVFVGAVGFNLDTRDFVKYNGARESMFGFSVAAHRDREYNWVLIGAPTAQTSQPGVVKGGAVYFCTANGDDGCREVEFDRTGSYNASNGADEKSFQWFGATLQSGGPDKPIVACAPRYLWHTLMKGRRDPVGTCYVSSSDFREFSEFSPCRTRNWGYHRQGSCQAGLGAAISKDGERVFIGAPGSWYWHGQMYSIDPEAKLRYIPPRYSNYGSSGQLYSQHLKKRPAVFFTQEGQPTDDDSYLGYSVTVGNFTGEKDTGMAAGMPRGQHLSGKVLLYTWNLTNYQNISGNQLGAYFGYAVASADMNGDGLDDLIVGAPLHTIPNNKGKYEVGRIYVLYPATSKLTPGKLPRLTNVDIRDGSNSKGRFGLSLASLGDLDLDGYQDIAVGAPYDGPNERGAVYIYYGSIKGIREKASQVIHSEDVSQSAMYTFGFSLAGAGIDLDNNQYPDLVVGAYLSESAFVFRARPVINVEAFIKFYTHNKVIGLEDKNCSISSTKSVACTSMEACVKYNGVGVSNGIDLDLEFTLDAKKPKDPRMFLLDRNPTSERKHKFTHNWRVGRNRTKCEVLQVYIRDNTRDKLTPLEVEMRYSLHQEQSESSFVHRRNPRSDLKPVLNGNLPSVFKDSIVIRKNCGSDDVCIPDLRLFVKPNVEKYLLGSGKRLEVDVIVKNEGEDSFESTFYMKMPEGINFFNTKKVSGDPDIPVKCSSPSEATNNTMKCDIGNPLPNDKVVHFKVMLEPYNVEGMKPSYDFFMKVNSTNPENNYTVSDNVQQLSIDIWVKTNLSLTGWALSPDIHYKENQYKEDNYTIETDIGPQIIHIYSIKNNGPSDINEAEVLFMWPSETLGGEDMLYLMEQPETQGKIRCEFVPEANALKVELLSKKYYLDSDGKISTSKVSIEEKLTSNVGSSISTSKQTKDESDKKFSETGDASHVHVSRDKEKNQVSTSNTVITGGGNAGSTTISKTENSYSWNSSSVNGGPATTWSRNSSSVTGQDGVTHHKEHSSGGQGQNINNYKIIYTSTGNQDGNRFGDANSQEKNQSFSISGQSNLSQYNFSQNGSGNSYYDSTIQGSTQPNQYGTIHHETRPSGGSNSGQSTYFNWENVDNSPRNKDDNAFGSVTTHQQASGEVIHKDGSSGLISNTGEIIYHQSGSSAESSETHQSGGSLDHGSFSHGISSSRDGGAIDRNQEFSSFGTQHSSSSSTGQTGGTSSREGNMDRNQGSSSFGTQHSGGSMDHNHYTGQSGGTSSREKNMDRNQGSVSGTHYGGHHSSSSRDEDQGSVSSTHYGGQSGGSSSVTTHDTSGARDHQGGSSSSSTHQRGNDAIYREFYTMSGQDLRGHLSEENLRRMLESGSGEFFNGTHKIRWSIDHHGTFKIQNNTGSRHQFGLSTEESVNPGLDDYTRTVTQGRGQQRSQSGRTNYGQYDQSNHNPNLGIGGAAIGSGFRTTALDIGTLGNSNTDETLSRNSDKNFGNSQNYGSNVYYDPDLGSYEDRSAEGQAQGSVSYGTSRTYSGGRQTSGTGGSQHSSSHYSSGQRHFVGDNVPTEYPADLDYRNRIYRNKRQVNDDFSGIIECKSTKCAVVRCTAGPLVKDEEAWTALKFRANAATMKKIGWTQVVTVSSMMVSRINKLPYIGTPNERPIHTHEVFTNVTLTETEIKADVVPLWVVVLSACAGAIILLLLIFLLYKCGFFKRNRPSDAPERQPLNRNGHYQGDEQL